MVYKVRNKGFVNWNKANSVRAYPAKKTELTPNLDQHITFAVQITRYTGMRIQHNYRNISRATKQFMMGDRFMEQLMILNLKGHFFHPMTYEAPIENTFFMGRNMADMTDRHYALFAANQHPIQLEAYDEYNDFLRDLHSQTNAANDVEDSARFDQVAAEREATLNIAEGESLSTEDISDIYFQVNGERRETNKMSMQTVTKTGAINDYLETRRPFGVGQ